MKIVTRWLVISCVLLLSSSSQSPAYNSLNKGEHQLQLPDALENPLKQIPVDIIISDSSCKKNILVLPGWNFSRKRWIQDTNLKHEAIKLGYNLILPEMSVTIYESQYFPETTRKWAKTPGSKWITTVLIPQLQKKGMLLSHQFNVVVGLSTGGRGAVLTPLYNKDIFKAAASLSGDFRQELMPNDRLMTAVYGQYTQFKERWETIDNPYYKIQEWDIPLYLGHGTKDSVVPFEQTKLFYEALIKAKPHLLIQFNYCECGHDFTYWGSQVAPILNFFEKVYISQGR